MKLKLVLSALVEGYLVPERRGQVWRAGHWEHLGRTWLWRGGGWRPHR